MSYVNLVPSAPVLTVIQGIQIQVPFATVDSSNANVNITTWNSFSFKVMTQNGNGSASDFLSITPTLGGGSGSALLPLSSSNTASLAPGTFRYVLAGKPTSGDDPQLVATGTIIVSSGS